jgi:AcrR family transcriptional regulator
MARLRSDQYDDRRQRILDQAAALFARHGFAATSLTMLAAACGTSKALVYHYYDSKQAILFDMLDRHVGGLVEITREALAAGGDPEAQLRHLIRRLMAAYVEARDKHVVLMNDMEALPPAQRAHLVDRQNEMVHAVADLVARLDPAGRLTQPATRTAVGMALLGMINWTYTWFRRDGALTPDAYAEIATEIWLRGITGGRLGASPPKRVLEPNET